MTSDAKQAEGERVPALAWLVLVAVVAFGAFLRVDGFDAQSLYGDEMHAAPRIAKGWTHGFDDVVGTFDRFGSHIGFPLAQLVAGEAFEPGVRAYRLPAVVAGIFGLLLLFPLARALVGWRAAWIATAALSLHPLHLYYSRFARPYTLVVLLGLCLALALHAVTRPERKPVRTALAGMLAIASGAALLYTHLSAAGLVAGVALASLFAAWHGRRRVVDLWLPIAIAVGIAALATALYAPAWEGGLRAYFESSSEGYALEERGDPSVLAMLALFGGTLTGGIALVVLTCVGAGALVRSKPRAGVMLALAVLGPVALLVVTRPPGGKDGGTFAYARYLIAALPFALVLAAHGLSTVVERVCAARRWSSALPVLAAGGAATLALALASPLLDAANRRGPFTNDYLAIRALAAFDAQAPAPGFYTRLANRDAPVTLVEFPVTGRARRLLRNYARTHGQRVLTGLFFPDRVTPATAMEVKEKDSLRILLNGPYVEITDRRLRRGRGPDYLILHRDLEAEIRRYSAFVADRWREGGAIGDDLFRSKPSPPTNAAQAKPKPKRQAPPRQKQTQAAGADETRSTARRLTKLYGKPIYSDDDIQVWELVGERE